MHATRSRTICRTALISSRNLSAHPAACSLQDRLPFRSLCRVPSLSRVQSRNLVRNRNLHPNQNPVPSQNRSRVPNPPKNRTQGGKRSRRKNPHQRRNGPLRKRSSILNSEDELGANSEWADLACPGTIARENPMKLARDWRNGLSLLLLLVPLSLPAQSAPRTVHSISRPRSALRQHTRCCGQPISWLPKPTRSKAL